ncbi:MAG: fibronectin type III domain-containing protein [Candidatus Zixiibacteriota bacterium]|nr:MAG: fibronectin type III domain-containing protein [candidate division Zixibacteria bacterium]
MRRLLIPLLVAPIIAGCGAPRKIAEGPQTECAPSNLSAKPVDQGIFLKWNTNCPDSILLSGYYIYLQDKPIYEKYGMLDLPSRIKPFNSTAYPGDTDPEASFETMTIENLENGMEYFISVRTVFPDRTISISSNEMGVICRPEGEFELAYRYAGLNDGFSFALGEHVRADAEENDLYFYNKDDVDYIRSPHKLNGFLRNSRFDSLGKTKDIYHYPELDYRFTPVETMPVREGESYLVRTADNRFAKIRIEKITGEGKERSLKVKYIYQTIEDLMRF